MLLDAVGIWFTYGLIAHDGAFVATIVLLVLGVINVAFIFEALAPLRWIVPGLALMVVFVLYPVMNTVSVALTNYGNGHLLTKQQAIAQFESKYYSPPGAPTYAWRAYRSSDDTFLLWLTDPQGQSFIGDPKSGIAAVRADDPRFGPKDDDGLPKTIGTYTKLSRLEVFPYLSTLQSFTLQAPLGILRIVSLDAAPVAIAKYAYDPVRDVLVDRETGTEYRNLDGTFTAANGEELAPGFSSFV
ncbi:MAG: hypothetical protein E6J23_00355, partial [Chloroflexi bacterium]